MCCQGDLEPVNVTGEVNTASARLGKTEPTFGRSGVGKVVDAWHILSNGSDKASNLYSSFW
ncbi:MAG: hypothetical protein WCG16_06145 [Methylococcales bacterium]